MDQFQQYKKVQGVAKKVLGKIGNYIHPESTESSIADKARFLLSQHGIMETWYYNVPAFVLLGSRSCLSISGSDYSPFHEKVGETNLVTVDLSPMMNGIWGDCARTFIVENGVVTKKPESDEFVDGILTENKLHDELINFVSPDTRFCDLFEFGNKQITRYGYENLDFAGNLGHSIEKDKKDRRYIDKNCHELLGDVSYFTFEPHIRKVGGKWGFKQEDIYYFDRKGQIAVL